MIGFSKGEHAPDIHPLLNLPINYIRFLDRINEIVQCSFVFVSHLKAWREGCHGARASTHPTILNESGKATDKL